MTKPTLLFSLAGSLLSLLVAYAAPFPNTATLISHGSHSAAMSPRDNALGFRCQGDNTFTLDGGVHTQTCAACLVCKEGVGCDWPDESGTCDGAAAALAASSTDNAVSTTAVTSPSVTFAPVQNAVVSKVPSDFNDDDCEDEEHVTGVTDATATPTPTPTQGDAQSVTDVASSTLDLQRNGIVTGTPAAGKSQVPGKVQTDLGAEFLILLTTAVTTPSIGETTAVTSSTPPAAAAATGSTTSSDSYSNWHATPYTFNSTSPGTTGACGWDLTTIPNNWVALGSDVFDLGGSLNNRNNNLQCGRKLTMKGEFFRYVGSKLTDIEGESLLKRVLENSGRDHTIVKGTGASIDAYVADYRGLAGGFDLDFDFMSGKMSEAVGGGGGSIGDGFDVDWQFTEPMLSAPRKP